jgi:hypothetical protein
MLGSLLFGMWYHFLLPGPDNIASLSAGIWQLPFRITAFSLALIEAAGTIAGAWLLFGTKRAQKAHPSCWLQVEQSDPLSVWASTIPERRNAHARRNKA